MRKWASKIRKISKSINNVGKCKNVEGKVCWQKNEIKVEKKFEVILNCSN